jgi:hypothetical protein
MSQPFSPLLVHARGEGEASLTTPLEQLRAIEQSRTSEQKKAWKQSRDQAAHAQKAADAKNASDAVNKLMRHYYDTLDSNAILTKARTQGTKQPHLLFQQITHIGAKHVTLGVQQHEGRAEVVVLLIPRERSMKITDLQHPLMGAMLYFSHTVGGTLTRTPAGGCSFPRERLTNSLAPPLTPTSSLPQVVLSAARAALNPREEGEMGGCIA